MSTSLRDNFRERIDELKTLRDQIRVDLKLASMELRNEWRDFEKRMPDAGRVAEDLKSATAETVEKLLAEARRFRARLAPAARPEGDTVAAIMSREVASCAPQSSLAEAARLMWERDVGALPVVENERVVAMVTDRDACMSAYMQGKRLDQIEVRTAMSRELHGCAPEASPAEAEAIMKTRQVRRLPVVDDQGHLLGILTLGDVARQVAASAEANRDGADSWRKIGATLAAIVAPRGTVTT
jgi:CBS domain-containing protein